MINDHPRLYRGRLLLYCYSLTLGSLIQTVRLRLNFLIEGVFLVLGLEQVVLPFLLFSPQKLHIFRSVE